MVGSFLTDPQYVFCLDVENCAGLPTNPRCCTRVQSLDLKKSWHAALQSMSSFGGMVIWVKDATVLHWPMNFFLLSCYKYFQQFGKVLILLPGLNKDLLL